MEGSVIEFLISKNFISLVISGGGKNFKMVTALVGPDKENMKECGSFKGPAKRSQFITFNCKEPVNGKFVKLQSKGINSLSFAELQVYAIH